MNKTRITCPICNKKTKNILRKVDEYMLCRECSLAWKKKISHILYDDNYYKGKSKTARTLFSYLSKFFYYLRNNCVKQKNYPLWIDVGAGDGDYLTSVKAKKRIGVEISKSGRKIMEQNGLSTISDREFLKSRKLHADVISYWHVLEHVDKPWEYLSAGYNNLSKKGRIVIGIPNHESLEFHVFGKYWFHLVPQFHLWHFSPKSIKNLLVNEGFRIEKIDYWSLEHHLTGVLQSFINWTTHSDSILHRMIRRRQDFTSLSFKDIFWIIFWCTIGSPLVISFWIIGALLKRPGTFIIVAAKSSKD